MYIGYCFGSMKYISYMFLRISRLFLPFYWILIYQTKAPFPPSVWQILRYLPPKDELIVAVLESESVHSC